MPFSFGLSQPLLLTGDIVELLGGGRTLIGDWEPGDIACLASFLSAAAKLEFCPPDAGELIGTLDPFVTATCKLPVVVDVRDDVTTFDILVFSSRFQTSASSPSGSLSPMTTTG